MRTDTQYSTQALTPTDDKKKKMTHQHTDRTESEAQRTITDNIMADTDSSTFVSRLTEMTSLRETYSQHIRHTHTHTRTHAHTHTHYIYTSGGTSLRYTTPAPMMMTKHFQHNTACIRFDEVSIKKLGILFNHQQTIKFSNCSTRSPRFPFNN